MLYDEMYSDVDVLDSGVVCPALSILSIFMSYCRVVFLIPVVENPVATRVRVSCTGGV